MDEKFGIENLKKVIRFGVDFGTNIKGALSDGKITLEEAVGLLPPILQVPALVKAKDDFVNEALDLSTTEAAQLAEEFKGMTGEKAQKIITDSFVLLAAAKNLASNFINAPQ
jgi:hypothetical protein